MRWILMVGFALWSAIAWASTGENIRQATKIDTGVAAVIGNVELAIELAGDGRLQVHLLVEDIKTAEAWRQQLHKANLGSRVVVDVLPDGKRLSYPDRLLNLLVADLDALGEKAPSESERNRILAVRGAAYFKSQGKWARHIPAADHRIDGWFSQWYDASGNCVSRDTAVAAPRAVQWQHGPAMEDRTADGKIVRVADGRVLHLDAVSGELYCRDAGNGTLLWRRFAGIGQSDEMVIAAGRVHLWHDEESQPSDDSKKMFERGPLVAIDLDSGKVVQTYGEGLRAGTARPQSWEALEPSGKPRTWSRTPVPWFTVNDRVVVQAYAGDLIVLDRKTGRQLWRQHLEDASWFSPVVHENTLVAIESLVPARRNRHDESEYARALAAFHLADGKPLWRVADFHLDYEQQDGKTGRRFRARAGVKPLSIRGDRLLVQTASYQFREGGSVAVHDLGTGRKLWDQRFQPKERYTHGSYRAVLRDDEVIVMCGLAITRYDAATGQLLAEIKPPKRRSARANAACTASRATDSLLAANAYMYVDDEGDLDINFGARGQCGQGVVPAHGMIFVCPTACDCGDYTRGYLGLSSTVPGQPVADAARLEQAAAAPDREQIEAAAAWNHFLGSPQRTSAVADSLLERLEPLWTARFDPDRNDGVAIDRRLSERWLGALSAPTVGEGFVVVSLPQRHEVAAVNLADGTIRWRQPSAGKIDSPPTIAAGMAVYGTAGGYVAARRLDDGRLVWRFRAAPTDGVSLHHGHLASPHPLPGSVLVLGETVIAVAGQHVDLGGLHVWALDLASGKSQAQCVLDDSQFAVTANGLTVADSDGQGFWLGAGFAGSSFHLSKDLKDLPQDENAPQPVMRFDRDGDRIRFRTADGRGGSTHGWKQAMHSGPVRAHRIAVSDQGVRFAAQDPTSRQRHSANAAKANTLVAASGDAREGRLHWDVSQQALGNPESISAVIAAGQRVYIAGGARDGSVGFVQTVDAETGKLGQRLSLPARVTECGLAAAGGRLLVCCENGSVYAFGK